MSKHAKKEAPRLHKADVPPVEIEQWVFKIAEALEALDLDDSRLPYRKGEFARLVHLVYDGAADAEIRSRCDLDCDYLQELHDVQDCPVDYNEAPRFLLGLLVECLKAPVTEYKFNQISKVLRAILVGARINFEAAPAQVASVTPWVLLDSPPELVSVVKYVQAVAAYALARHSMLRAHRILAARVYPVYKLKSFKILGGGVYLLSASVSYVDRDEGLGGARVEFALSPKANPSPDELNELTWYYKVADILSAF